MLTHMTRFRREQRPRPHNQKSPYALLKSDVTRRDHVSVVMDAGSRIVNFIYQFHSRWHSLRITLKYTKLVCMRSSYAWTMKPWQRSEWRLGFNSLLSFLCLVSSQSVARSAAIHMYSNHHDVQVYMLSYLTNILETDGVHYMIKYFGPHHIHSYPEYYFNEAVSMIKIRVMPWSHLCVKPPRMSNVRQI